MTSGYVPGSFTRKSLWRMRTGLCGRSITGQGPGQPDPCGGKRRRHCLHAAPRSLHLPVPGRVRSGGLYRGGGHESCIRPSGTDACLAHKGLRDMEAPRCPFTFLMPADEAIYTPFDFRLMGNDDEEGLSGPGSEELAEDYDLFAEKDEAYAGAISIGRDGRPRL